MNNEDKLYLPSVSLDYGNSQTLLIKWEKVCKMLPIILVTSLYQIFALSPLLLYLPCSVLRDKKIPRHFQVSSQNVPSFSPTQACQTCGWRACGLLAASLTCLQILKITEGEKKVFWTNSKGYLLGALKCRDQHRWAPLGWDWNRKIRSSSLSHVAASSAMPASLWASATLFCFSQQTGLSAFSGLLVPS